MDRSRWGSPTDGPFQEPQPVEQADSPAQQHQALSLCWLNNQKGAQVGGRSHTEEDKVAQTAWDGVCGGKHRLGHSCPHSSAHWQHPLGLPSPPPTTSPPGSSSRRRQQCPWLMLKWKTWPGLTV